jgi:hypothetical protein
MANKEKTALSISPEIKQQITARAGGDGRSSERYGFSGVIERDLDRYYLALRYARAELREILSGDEVAAIVDNLNGVWMMPAEVGVRLIWANVEDGIDLEQLDKKWGIDGAALVAKLKALNFIQSAALADAVERFWLGDGSYTIKADPRAALTEPARIE